MEQFDIGAAVIILLGLVTLARIERMVKSEDSQAYWQISGGLSILATITLARICNNLGLWANVPFLSEPVFFQLTNWIAVIAGSTLLASGVSQWLPISRAYRRLRESKMRQLELIRDIERLTAQESDVRTVLVTALEAAMKEYRFDSGAVLSVSQRAGRPAMVLMLSNSPAKREGMRKALKKMLPTAAGTRVDTTDFLSNWSSVSVQPSLVMPVTVGSRTTNIFLFWSDEPEITDDARINLKTALDIVGRFVQGRAGEIGVERLTAANVAQQDLLAAFDGGRNLADNIGVIRRTIEKRLRFDWLSLTVRTDNDKIERYSIGENKTTLNEKGLDASTFDIQTSLLFSDTMPVVLADISDQGRTSIGSMILNSDMRSVALIPIIVDSRISGVMAIASRAPQSFRISDLTSIMPVAELLGRQLKSDRARNRLRKEQGRLEMMRRFMGEVASNNMSENLWDRAATILSDELGTTLVRISMFDNTGSFLDSHALILKQPVKSITPADGHMILSLMPRHRQIRNEGHSMVLSGEDRHSSVGEPELAQAFFAGAESILMVPIKVGEVVKGVISIAEARSHSQFQFGQSDIIFAETIASGLALAANKQSHTEPVIFLDRRALRMEPQSDRMTVGEVQIDFDRGSVLEGALESTAITDKISGM